MNLPRLPALHPNAYRVVLIAGGVLLLLSAFATRKPAGDEPKRPSRVSA